jgi:cyanophycin synthetase
VGKKLIAAAKGESLWITGDGQHTIKQLCDMHINIDPRRGETEGSPLGLIKPDVAAEIILELKRQNMTHESVPAANHKVLIQPNGNVAVDVTDLVHPDTAEMATLAARVIGLDIAGIDLVAQDISRPLEEQGGAIIEVNASPGLLAHLKPAEGGQPRPVGAAIVDQLFAEHDTGRIPVVGVAGERHSALIANLTAWLLQVSGKSVGLSCEEGIYLNGRKVPRGPLSAWDSGQRLLLNRNVEAAVFHNGSRMILSEGLAYDKCSVGIVTDTGGHGELGEFYIRDEEDMYGVLRTQVDVVLPEGAAVLNAAEPQVVEMAELCDGAVIFYGLDEQLPAIVEHRQDGERAVFLRPTGFVLAAGANEVAMLPLSCMPAGQAGNEEAVLAAIAAGWALELEPGLIAAALRTFKAN